MKPSSRLPKRLMTEVIFFPDGEDIAAESPEAFSQFTRFDREFSIFMPAYTGLRIGGRMSGGNILKFLENLYAFL